MSEFQENLFFYVQILWFSHSLGLHSKNSLHLGVSFPCFQNHCNLFLNMLIFCLFYFALALSIKTGIGAPKYAASDGNVPHHGRDTQCEEIQLASQPMTAQRVPNCGPIHPKPKESWMYFSDLSSHGLIICQPSIRLVSLAEHDRNILHRCLAQTNRQMMVLRPQLR